MTGPGALELAHDEAAMVAAFRANVYDFVPHVDRRSPEEQLQFLARQHVGTQQMADIAWVNAIARRLCAEGIAGNFVQWGCRVSLALLGAAMVVRSHSTTPRMVYVLQPRPKHCCRRCAEIEHEEHQARRLSDEAKVNHLWSTTGVDYLRLVSADARWIGMAGLILDTGCEYAASSPWESRFARQTADGAFIATVRAGIRRVRRFEWRERPSQQPNAVQREFLQDDVFASHTISQMSRNERYQLYQLSRQVAGRSKVGRFVEVGSYFGASLSTMAGAMSRIHKSWFGVSIDSRPQPALRQLIATLQPNVKLLAMRSSQAADLTRRILLQTGGLASLVFIDGDHRLDAVAEDILAYGELLAIGGTLVLHDYLPALSSRNRAAILSHHGGAEPGVRAACSRLLDGSYEFARLRLPPQLLPRDPSATVACLPLPVGWTSTLRAYRRTASR